MIGYSLPPAVKTTGTRATRSKRLSSSERASLRQPADVDAGDLDALGDPHRRAGEGKADQRRQDGEKREGTRIQRATGRAGSFRYPGADRCRVYPHEPVSVATAQAGTCCQLVVVT